jgi:hypothetical protein
MSRSGIRCCCSSGPGCDAEILRNALAPFGFGRRGAIGGVAATRRCKGIAFVASSSRLPRGAPNDAIAISDSGH